MPTPSTYFSYRELFDRVPTQGELAGIITGLNAFNTVLLTARLNTIFRHSVWSSHPEDTKALDRFQIWFATVFFDPETKQLLEQRFGDQSPTRRPVCHPLQFLNIMRLALCVAEGDESTRPDASHPHSFRFGTASLIVNDLFVTAAEQENLRVGTNDDKRRQLMLQSLASIEISNPTDPRNLQFRAYGMYHIALRDPQLLDRISKECGGLDIERDFEKLFGVPLFGWLSLVFGVQSLLLSFTHADFLNKPETFLINRRTILQAPNLSRTQIDDFFDRLSLSFEDLRLELRKERPVDDRLDVVPFKSRPLLVTAPDSYACLDFGLFTEKMHTGPYFLLANRLPSDERWKIFNAWGLLFEAYVNWLLRSLGGKFAAELFSDTCWIDDDTRAFDAVFVKRRMVVAMEFKGGFLPQNARYSNDLDTFMAALKERVGDGCHQLARDIGSLFPETGPARKLRGVAIPPNAAFVLPVLVVQDLILRAPFINYFLNQSFQSERAQFRTRKGIEVLPLTVIQITELENLVERAEACDFDVLHFFHRRCQLDREMLGDITNFRSLIPSASRDRPTRFQEVLDRGTEDMCAILFKEGSDFEAHP
jgi:hypothetical protein